MGRVQNLDKTTLPATPPALSETYACDFAVDLRSILALGVRILGGGHLQNAHSESVHVHGLIVLFLIHLRSHEFRRSCIETKTTTAKKINK